MRSVAHASLALTLCAVVLLPSVAARPVRAEDDPRIRAYEQELERMQHQMDELRSKLQALEKERGMKPKAETSSAAAKPAAAAAAAAEAAGAAAPASTAEQDRKIDVLAHEVESLKSKIVLPEGKELKSVYGFGPAASKIYQVDRGLSIGGYGELTYENLVKDQHGEKDRFDLERFVLYTGYKFSDRILLNSEIEFEHATTEETKSSDDGAVSVEFANLDFLLWKALNVRAGLLLVPMGFLNEMHEPPFYYGVFRPEVEREKIIPSTWAEGGFGFFGTLAPGLDYRAYLLTSLNAKGFAPDGIGEARQKGKKAFADDFSGTVRLDYTPFPGATVGASFWAGDSGQNQTFDGRKPDVFTLIWEAHAQLNYRGFHFRTLGAFDDISDAAIVSRDLGETIAEHSFGYYAEVAYNVLPWIVPSSDQAFEPFFRYEIYDTQDGVPKGFARVPGNDVKLYTVGASYRPHSQVVLKVEYRDFHAGTKQPIADEVNVGAGFVF